MTVNPNDILRVVCKLSEAGHDRINVFHGQYLGSEADQDAFIYADCAGALDAAYTPYAEDLNSSMHFDTIEMFNVTQDLPINEEAWPSLEAGTSIVTTGPVQCAPLVVFGTNAPRSHGRKYMPPPVLDSTTGGGQLTGDIIANLAFFGASLLEDVPFLNGLVQWGVWSEKYSRFAPYVNALVDTYIRTQRRRLPGVGS